MKDFLSKLLGKAEAPDAKVPDQDFSHVRSLAQAKELVNEGKLFKVLLFPEEFGGKDIPPNVVYVPRGIPEARERVIGTLLRLAREGTIDRLEVNPEYKGDSFVPSKIRMRAWHSGKQGGEFQPSVDIW